MNCFRSSCLAIGWLALYNVALPARAFAEPSAARIQLAQFLNFGQPSTRAVASPEVESENLAPLEGADQPAKPAPRTSSRSRRNATPPEKATPPESAELPTGTTPQPKENKRVAVQRAKRFPSTAPLPPPRPWGARDAGVEVEVATPAPAAPAPSSTQTAAIPAAPAPAVKPPGQPPQEAPKAPVAVLPPPVAVAPSPERDARPRADQAIVILVRNDVAGPQDLAGRKVALGPTTATPDGLRGAVQANAGVTLDPVPLNWTSGLQGLARGEVAGVLLSVGPKMSSEEMTSVALGSYKLLEIPIHTPEH